MTGDDARAPRARLQLLTGGDAEGGRVLAFPPAARPLSATDWYERGCELEESAPAEAIESYRRAIASRPDHAGARVNLGRLLHLAGDAAGAEFHYRRALLAIPADPIAWFDLGIALEDLGRADEALDAYRRSLELDPGLSDAHYNASRLCERLGRPVDALRHLSAYRRATRR